MCAKFTSRLFICSVLCIILVRGAAFKRRRNDYANLLVSMEFISIYLHTFAVCTYRRATSIYLIKVVAVVISSVCANQVTIPPVDAPDSAAIITPNKLNVFDLYRQKIISCSALPKQPCNEREFPFTSLICNYDVLMGLPAMLLSLSSNDFSTAIETR